MSNDKMNNHSDDCPCWMCEDEREHRGEKTKTQEDEENEQR